MLRFSDTSHISASPEEVWRFFAEMESHYRDWHPEHVVWRDLKGNATVVGSVIFADEHVGRLRLKDKFFDLEAENRLGYDARFVGALLDRLLARVMPADDLRRHMREEGENLDRLLAAAPTPTP